MRQPRLVLSAVVSVTIPGVLAIFAVLGHEHAAVQPARITAFADQSLTGPFPVAPPTVHAAVRNAVATDQRTSGDPVTVLNNDIGSGPQAAGMRLLSLAADAGQATSYQGVELTSQAEVGGRVTTLSQVWHLGGGVTIMQPVNAAPSGQQYAAISYVAGDRSLAGVFGVTRDLVTLLGRHYVAMYRGTGSYAGRAAMIVEVYRFDGTIAARFWLDSQTKVPLRRELYDTADRMVSVDAFVRVQFGALAGQPAAVQQQPAAAWVAAAPPGKLLASLAAQGWRLPATLPGALPLYAGASTGTGTGQVVDLEYSDGLYAVSLFVQRGTLAPDLAGWRPMSLNGYQVYVLGHSVVWAGHGVVYTMIADAPPQTVAQVVGVLPQNAPPGFLGRLSHGLHRLAELVNPFG